MRKDRKVVSAGRLATVTSLVERRVKRQSAAAQVRQLPGGELRDELAPDGNGSSADTQSPGDIRLAPEMSDGSVFVHAAKLSMPSFETQPYLAESSLSLLYMKDQRWKNCKTRADRLNWALSYAGKIQAELARHLGISSAGMTLWFSGTTKNPQLDHFFRAAMFCKVNVIWLALGEGSPYDGIGSEYESISGEDLGIAKELSRMDDQGLRETVGELIAAKQLASPIKTDKKRKL